MVKSDCSPLQGELSWYRNALSSFLTCLKLWTDSSIAQDLLDVQAWELSEDFLLKYPTLVDVGMLQTCNKWRMTRNATIIVL